MAKYNVEDILDNGIELMRTNGYHGTGIQHVLKACGIPKGSFYHFFDSKQDFVLKSVERYASNIANELMMLLADDSQNGKEKLESFFKSQSRFYEQKNFKMTCLMSILSFEMGGANPDIELKINEKFETMKSLIEKMVEEGQMSGHITKRLSPRELTDYLVNSFNGALITMKYEQSAHPLQQFFTVNMSFLNP